MMKRVTAQDVALAAGVSRATVSFVVNDVRSMRISGDTRARVLATAEQLGYQPNASARRLVSGQTNILAYVERQSPDRALADAFLPPVLRGVCDVASADEYEVLLAPIPVEEGPERCLRMLRGRHVDGIILSGPRSDDQAWMEAIGSDVRIVVQGDWPGGRWPSVDVDNVAAARRAVELLIKLGHCRVAMIVHAPTDFTAAAARLEGYRQALQAHGLPFDPGWVAQADFSLGSGESAMDRLLDSRERPSAVFAGSDTVAIGAMRALRSRRLRIPDDVALVGFDDIPMAVYVDPPLTTVRLPAYHLGRAAADLLIRAVTSDGPTDPTRHLLQTELIVRESSGA